MVKRFSTPVERSRHRKRLPDHGRNNDNDNDNDNDHMRGSGNTTTTPTVTSDFPRSPVPSRSSLDSHTNAGHSHAATGAIVGIILGIVVLLAAGGVFWFRRRSIAKRLEKRQWAKQQDTGTTGTSFLFIEPKESVTSSNTLQTYRGGDPAVPVNMMFAGPDGVTQAMNNGPRLPYIPSPARPRPPPVAGIYDTRTTPGTMSPSTTTARVLSPSVKSSLTTSPLPPKQAEIAKVRSTFIPTLPDELTISTRDMVRIHTEYDDGWCLCSNARGEMGMVPLECLDRASQLPQERPANRDYRKSIRVSSLSTASKSPYSGITPKSPFGGNILSSPHGGSQQ